MAKIDFAKEYAERGWPVMPLHSIDENGVCTCHKADCKTPAKHPRLMNPLNDATIDLATIEKWWRIWPDANIGLITGHRSGVVVLDCDPKNGGNEALRELLKTNGEFGDDKVSSKTGGGGYHLFFQHPGGHWPNTQGSPTRPSCIGWGLDWRGDGGYVAAPGSTHKSGKDYTWLNKPNGHLPTAPEWLLEKLRNRHSALEIPKDAEGEILPGNRHNILRAWACQMRGKGMSKQAIRSALVSENSTRFSEPKPDDEVDRIIEYACKFQPGEVPHWREADDKAEIPDGLFIDDLPGIVSNRSSGVKLAVDALFDIGAQRGLSTGWKNLDELYSVHRGDLTINVAAPSAGKTTFGLNLISNMATLHDWKIAVCSTENRISHMIADLAGMINGATYYGNYKSNQMTRREKEFVDDFIYEHFRFIAPVRGEEFSLQYVLSRAEKMQADGVMIDPFGAIALPKGGSNDSRLIRDLLHGVLQPFAKDTQSHVWLMVHTTKMQPDKNGDTPMPTPYNATDSAGFFNAGDFLIGQRRPQSRGGKITELSVQKVKDRFSGQIGECSFGFDHRTGRYLEIAAAIEADYEAEMKEQTKAKGYNENGGYQF